MAKGSKKKAVAAQETAPEKVEEADAAASEITQSEFDHLNESTVLAGLLQPTEQQMKVFSEFDQENNDDDDVQNINHEQTDAPSVYAEEQAVNQAIDEQLKKMKDLEDFIDNIPDGGDHSSEATTQHATTSSEVLLSSPPQTIEQFAHYTVNVFDHARQGNLLPWTYAIANNLIPIEQCDSEGYHLIHRATSSGQLDVIIFLIEKSGLPVDFRDVTSQQTSLMMASLYGHIKIMKYLIDAGADVNAIDGRNFTPLMNCVLNRFKFHSIYLISQGASLHSLDFDGCSLAHRAAFNNDVEMLQLIFNLDKTIFDHIDNLRMSPLGRAITNDAHQAFEYLQRVRPIQIPSSRSLGSLDNKCMLRLIEAEHNKQSEKAFTKEWVGAKYAEKPADLAVFLYATLIGVLYYAFVKQTGVLYYQSDILHGFCNAIHGLTVFLMTYVFIFALKMPCPSSTVKGDASKNAFDFSKLNLKIVDFQFINGFFSDVAHVDDDEDEIPTTKGKSVNRQARVGQMNLVDYVSAIVINEKFDEFKQLSTHAFCFECLKPRTARGTHCEKFEVCVENFSHYSAVFGKLIVSGNNSAHYFTIILLQWTLLLAFFAANYLYCHINKSFIGNAVLALLEIPYIYYCSSQWMFFASYLLAVGLFYLASVYLVMEIVAKVIKVTRFELLEPQKCNYFYENKNIVELSASSRRPPNADTSYVKLYKNPF